MDDSAKKIEEEYKKKTSVFSSFLAKLFSNGANILQSLSILFGDCLPLRFCRHDSVSLFFPLDALRQKRYTQPPVWPSV